MTGRFVKRALLVIAIVLVAIQLPFIYRRYQYGKLSETISTLQSSRRVIADPAYDQYRGVIHVHTSLGGHSTGGFDELINAANEDGLDFVVMTEHVSELYDTAKLTLDGRHGKTLFVAGNETRTSSGDSLLVLPGGADVVDYLGAPTAKILAEHDPHDRIMFVAYPERFNTWESAFDGIEVFSLNTAAKDMNPLLVAGDWIWSGSSYPRLVISSQFVRPSIIIGRFDGVSTQRHVSMFIGTDAHSNIGIKLLGDDAGHSLLHLKIDDYATILGLASVNVLIPKGSQLTRESLLDAIRAGRYYTAIAAFGDAGEFNFIAGGNGRMGDDVPYSDSLTLRVESPIRGRVVIIKDGTVIRDEMDTDTVEFRPDGPGVYRTEVYLSSLGSTGENMPWIMSNPIYVR